MAVFPPGDAGTIATPAEGRVDLTDEGRIADDTQGVWAKPRRGRIDYPDPGTVEAA